MTNFQITAKKEITLSSARKWFWLAILVSGPLAGFTGLVLGIALLFEAEHRKNGWILIGWAILWNIIVYFLAQWLIQQGYVPRFQPVLD